HSEGQLRVGIMYLKGENVPQNITKGIQWLERAWDQSCDDETYDAHGSILYNPRRLSSWQAADALNVIFFDENSPKKHPIERIERLKKRALEGSCSFQYILAKACLFYRNEDFPLEDAFKYFLLSAVNRLPVAEFMVIFLLENGFGPQTPLGLH